MKARCGIDGRIFLSSFPDAPKRERNVPVNGRDGLSLEWE